MPANEKAQRGPHVKIPRLEARLKKEMLLERVAEYDQSLATELRAVDALLAVYETTQGSRFSSIRSTQKAVLKCLEEAGRPMRPREIAAELAEGGFAMDPSNGPRLVVDSIRGMVDGGKLIKLDETVDLAARPNAPAI